MFELCVNEARFGLARVLPTLLSFNPQTVEVPRGRRRALHPGSLSGEQGPARHSR
jgi:hypothetical protein